MKNQFQKVYCLQNLQPDSTVLQIKYEKIFFYMIYSELIVIGH